MQLLFKIAMVAVFHLAFFAGYPDTGPYGNYFLAVSLVIWTGFMLFVSTAVRLARFLSGALGLVLNLAIFGLMAVSIAFTMPQEDKTRVLEKLQKGRYPDLDTFRHGMGRFGFDLEKKAAKGAEELRKEAEKALEQAAEKAADR